MPRLNSHGDSLSLIPPLVCITRAAVVGLSRLPGIHGIVIERPGAVPRRIVGTLSSRSWHVESGTGADVISEVLGSLGCLHWTRCLPGEPSGLV